MKIKTTFPIIALTFFSLSANAQIINTVAGNGTLGSSGDGAAATLAQLRYPTGVCLDAVGNLYIADASSRIRKVNTSGIISTIAGTGVAGYSGDGAAATLAQLNYSSGVAVDVAGNVYIADYLNHRIRKVNTSGIISTIAGTGVAGYSGDGAAATLAQLNQPTGVAVDASGNLYVVEYSNNRIRQVNSSGIISTIAGTGVAGYSGDGAAATLAQLKNPYGVAVDATGNVYIADYFNNSIRKVNTSGIISTVAGSGIAGYSGDGAAATLARLWLPTGVSVDAAGNLYIADQNNDRIRKVNTSGIISTIAGNGVWGYSGDGAAATLAQLRGPTGVAVDAASNLYIADQGNHRIRKVTAPTGVTELSIKNEVSIYPNPNAGSFKLQIEIEIQNGVIILINSLGQRVYDQTVRQGINNITTSGLSKGLYNYILLQDKQKIGDGKVVVD